MPLAGNALAVFLGAGLDMRYNRRRERWFTQLAEAAQKLSERVEDFDPESLIDSDLFADAVVSAIRTVDHTDQENKLRALCNAVLNSVGPQAPDADSRAILLSLIDRFTPSHLRLLTLLDDPAAWFASQDTDLSAARLPGNRVTVEAGLPEMRSRQDLHAVVHGDLYASGLAGRLVTGLATQFTPESRHTTDFRRQLVRFIADPAQLTDSCAHTGAGSQRLG